jgi:phospholipase C
MNEHRHCADASRPAGAEQSSATARGEPSRRAPSRRDVLQVGLAAAAGLGAAGWALTSAACSSPGPVGHIRHPGSLPYPNLREGTDTIPRVQHIVVLMMENHSYDNKLGMLRRPGADGFRLGPSGTPRATNPYSNGDIQHAFRMPTTCQLNGKPSQHWTDSHTQFAGGHNNGFVVSGSGPVAMGYWEGADQPFYYSLARTFPIADRYFCSVLGQTFPNRRYLISATSLGMINDTPLAATDYPPNGTIFDKLDAVGVSWKDYFSTGPSAKLYPKLYLKNAGTKVVPIAHFFADAAAGTLPGFALVEPGFGSQSEEDPQDIAVGEQFAARVINAVMSGPAWPTTLLIWTYDEHGGYYDHVPPPPAFAPDTIPPAIAAGESAYNGFAQYGFRVPFAIVSPWSRPRYVSHEVMDHTSICALVEAKWNLPAMTYRDANARTPLHMLDLHRPAFLNPPALAQPLVSTDPGALSCLATGAGAIPPPRSVTGPGSVTPPG